MNRYDVRRWIAALLCLAVMLGALPPAARASGNKVYVRVHSKALGRYNAQELVDYQGEAYIQAKSMAMYADMQLDMDGNTAVFTREGSVFREEIGVVYDIADGDQQSGRAYVPLRSSADALKVRYYYNADTETLTMLHSEVLVEDLLICVRETVDLFSLSGIFSGPAELYPGFLKDLTSLINAIGNMDPFAIIGMITGGYDEEIFEDLLYNMLKDDGIENMIAASQDGVNMVKWSAQMLAECYDNYMDVMSEQELIGEYGFLQLIGWGDYKDSVSELAGVVNGLVETPGINLNNAVEVMSYLSLAAKASVMTKRGFEYSLIRSPYLTEDAYPQLYQAVYRLNAFLHSKDEPDIDQFLEYGLETLAKDTGKWVVGALEFGDKVSKCVHFFCGWMKSVAIGGFNVVLGTKINAVESAYLMDCIQDYIRPMMQEYADPKDAKYDPVAAKYSALFYLRGSEVAYEKFYAAEPNTTVSGILDRIRERKALLFSYSDELLTGQFKNEPLELGQAGFSKRYFPDLSEAPQQQMTIVTAMARAYVYAAAESQGSGGIAPYRMVRYDYNSDSVYDWVMSCDATPHRAIVIDGTMPDNKITLLESPDGRTPLKLYAYTKGSGLSVGYWDPYKEEWALVRYNGAMFEPYRTDPKKIPVGESETEMPWQMNFTAEHTFTIQVPAVRMQHFLSAVSSLDWASEYDEGDLNGDGLDDALIEFRHIRADRFICGDPNSGSRVDRPYDIDGHAVGVLLTDGGDPEKNVRVSLMTREEALALILCEQPGTTPMPESHNDDAERDQYSEGDHHVLMFRNRTAPLHENESLAWEVGCTEYYDRHETYTTQQVAMLKPGDMLHDTQIWQVNGDTDDGYIAFNNGEILLEEIQDGVWRVYQTTVASVVYDSLSARYLCLKDCEYLLEDYVMDDSGELVEQMVSVSDPEALFVDDGDWVETIISVVVHLNEDGYVTSIARENWNDFAYDYFVEVYRDEEAPDDEYDASETDDPNDPMSEGTHRAVLDRTEITDRDNGGWMILVQAISSIDVTLTRQELMALTPGDRIYEFTVSSVEIDEEDGMAWLNDGDVLLRSYDGGDTWEVEFALDETWFADLYTVGYDLDPGTDFIRESWDETVGESVLETVSTPYDLLEVFEISTPIYLEIEGGRVTKLTRYLDRN